ncbi:hypothetical protein M2459_003148 [Parabacteroides sp. PF5-5]|uniref:DUF3127 domain-containing protein n=1 Tax=unclassified Parabacteroides TaxID=2649774 RepID=UPI002473E5E3|nr:MULTISPECIES: DUF3127 domain-containing protein [unclassified Parabacteroides]MDH6306424.1 hypothetical protein [Parabacteroides sp. PH5-39]MDH6317424.1 hypothetical protein [Parabacteroides sp. PF5-13]MDH6321135.1 hypothetical protein [Parabacteroides sp. PH5-13]MDH6324867.1 hypothetical protein [Parabacteroides sp. PH5-8]MDH6328609.1 hypothetical protein [Parabacteroides sp. PH5-41]
MEVRGKIIAVLPEQGGTSKTGNEWKKQEYVLETYDQYPKKVCFQIFGGDKIEQAAIQAGEDLTVFFDIESREYNGRWYTNINAWKVERDAAAGGVTPGNAMPPSAPIAPAQDFPPSNPTDDLPF